MELKKKIIVFSDIHLTGRGKKIIGLDPGEKLSSALSHALCNNHDADHIIFTGDLSHDGDLSSYLYLKELLLGIEIPITFMMGNHDHRKTFASVFSSSKADKNGFFQSSISYSPYQLLFLDTLQSANEANRKGEGYLCEKRLIWLEQQLVLALKKKVILFMHHPPINVGFGAMDKIKLANNNEFFSLLDKYQNVVHIIAGHIHRTISGNSRGYSFSIFKSTCHQMPMMLDSDNVKLSAAEPPAYGVLLLNEEGFIVHTEDYELSEQKKITFNDYNQK